MQLMKSAATENKVQFTIISTAPSLNASFWEAEGFQTLIFSSRQFWDSIFMPCKGFLSNDSNQTCCCC
uniref:Uncharacterized protein n=1 Tax=Arundo donax TaxID=35708 RepID=A0A0A8YXY2_ARUDO